MLAYLHTYGEDTGMCVCVCVCVGERDLCVSARDGPSDGIYPSLVFADTTHGSQRKISLTRASWSRFNTGENEVDFGRGRAASSSAMTIYGHGRRGLPVTVARIRPLPFPTGRSPGDKAGDVVMRNVQVCK